MFEESRAKSTEPSGFDAELPSVNPAAKMLAPTSPEHGTVALPITAWMEQLGSLVGWLAAPGNSAATAAALDQVEALDPAGLIDQVRALEELKAAASAAQARATAVFDALTRRAQAAAGVKAEQLGKGVGAQIGLARRESPNRGTRMLGLARILTREMPHTLHALTLGVISEYRATLLVKETACLSLADRQRIDEQVAGNLAELEKLGDRQLVARIKTLSYALDPHSVVNRASKAASERFVSCRPAPDTMTYLTGLLPVAQGVGVYAALSREADRLRAAGDGRTRGQIMADTLVERITGRARAEDVRVEVQLVMTDRTLYAGSAEPAVLPGYGVIPAQLARDLVRNGETSDKTSPTWLRRLYTAPSTGQLVGMDSRARLVPEGLARFIAVRDQVCRMPWCGAPIRHYDHIKPFRDGGPTSAENLQGLCEACNQAKEAPGWSASTATSGTTHTVETVTPTGHRYGSTSPPLPGTETAVPDIDEAASAAEATIKSFTVVPHPNGLFPLQLVDLRVA